MECRANSNPATPQCIIEAKRRGRETLAATRAAGRMVRVGRRGAMSLACPALNGSPVRRHPEAF